MKTRYTFAKKEHLCGKKRIESLFLNNSSFVSYPLRVVYAIETENPCNIPSRVLFSVSKKRCKKAVDRNNIKRHLRERYRTNKLALIETLLLKQKSIEIAFIYLGDDTIKPTELNNAIEEALNRIIKKVK